MAIEFAKDVPDWIKEWVVWSAGVLVPEWDIDVQMKECIDSTILENKGEMTPYPGYLSAAISYQSDITNTENNIVQVIVHEVVHIFTNNMNSSADTLISSKTVRETAWKKFEHAEEETVVRLSRALVQLRKKLDAKL